MASYARAGEILTAFIAVALLTFAVRRVLRLLWHPLSHVPGPALAAFSSSWLVYHEYFQSTNLIDLLARLHREYGPVVRYSPNAVHFANPQAYWDIYARTSKWDKDPHLYSALGDEVSSFGLTSYKKAKTRKDIVSGFFSRRSVLGMQSGLIEQTAIMIDQLLDNQKKHHHLNLTMALRCLTQDIITGMCVGRSTGELREPGFLSPRIQAIDDNLSTFTFLKSFPLLRQIIYSTPLAAWVPGEKGLEDLENFVVSSVEEAMQDPEQAPKGSLLRFLLDYNEKTSKKLTPEQIMEEVGAFVGGGGETVAMTLITGFHHILQQRQLCEELLSELTSVWPKKDQVPPGLEQLEQLPLLTAFIKESLRLSHGPVTPAQRVVPPTGAVIDGLRIPAGTSVGVSHVFIHMSSPVFEDPQHFIPARWLSTSTEDRAQLDSHLVAFGRGPRSCTGINAAWAELYVVSAILLRLVDFKLVPGINDEHLTWRDCFLPHITSRHLMVTCSGVDS